MQHNETGLPVSLCRSPSSFGSHSQVKRVRYCSIVLRYKDQNNCWLTPVVVGTGKGESGRTPEAGERGGNVCVEVPRELLIGLRHDKRTGSIVRCCARIVVGCAGVCAACTNSLTSSLLQIPLRGRGKMQGFHTLELQRLQLELRTITTDAYLRPVDGPPSPAHIPSSGGKPLHDA